MAACAPQPQQFPPEPLLVPTTEAFPEVTGASFAAQVFHVNPAAVVPVADRGSLRDFEWLNTIGTPFIRITVSLTPSQVVVRGGTPVVTSNGVTVREPEALLVEPPRIPDLLPWTSAPSTVLVMTAEPASVRLTDDEGTELEAGVYRCTKPSFAPMQTAGVECVVFRQQPLQAGGFAGSSVRALSSSAVGLVLTRAVKLP